jgi:hypothetical protein
MELEKNSPSLLQSASTYGLFMGLGLALIQTIQYLSDQIISPLFSIITFVLSIVAIVFIIKHHREEHLNGWLEYKEGVKIGTLSAIFGGLFLGAFMLVLVQFLDKDYIEKFLFNLEEKYIEMGIDGEKLEQAMEQQRKNINIWSFAYGPIIQYAIGGLIVSLVASIFLRKSSDNSFEKDTI